MVIGIDLGTTFSAVATVGQDGKATVLTNRDGERTTPSVVMFEDGSVIVGEQAKDNSIVSPYSVCQFIKRQIGKKAFSFDVSPDERYTAEEISAMILRRLKEDAEAATGNKVDGAVITVPAYFDDSQRTATYNAGEIAGMKVLGIVNEPTAAAIAYCHGQSDADGNIMVYDLGGGTFDITIIHVSDNFKKVDILSTTGNRNLGGFDFDNVIISKVIDEFNANYNIDLEDDDTACQDLRIKAETAKKALSTRPKATISIVSNGRAFKSVITREEFESLISGYIESTKASMEIALDDAGLGWGDIAKILLVGGSTRIPAIQEMIKNLSGIEPSKELNPDEAVAIGAAYYAEMLRASSTGGSQAEEIKVTDVNSHSLGVITHDENDIAHASFILNRNTPLPASGEANFFTKVDNQEQIDLQVIEGEDDDPSYDTVIGRTDIKLIKRPAGSPLIISMQYDVNGMIHVYVRDGVDNRDLGEMEIKRDANLSGEEVQEKKYLLDQLEIE